MEIEFSHFWLVDINYTKLGILDIYIIKIGLFQKISTGFMSSTLYCNLVLWNFPHFIGGRGQCSGSVISTPKIWVSKWIKSPKYSFRRNVFFPHWGVWHSEYFWVLDSGLYSALSQCCWGIILVMLVMTSTPPVFPNLMLGTQVVNTTPSPTMGFWRQNLEKNKRFVILKWFLGKFEQFWKKLFFHLWKWEVPIKVWDPQYAFMRLVPQNTGTYPRATFNGLWDLLQNL